VLIKIAHAKWNMVKVYPCNNMSRIVDFKPKHSRLIDTIEYHIYKKNELKLKYDKMPKKNFFFLKYFGCSHRHMLC